MAKRAVLAQRADVGGEVVVAAGRAGQARHGAGHGRDLAGGAGHAEAPPEVVGLHVVRRGRVVPLDNVRRARVVAGAHVPPPDRAVEAAVGVAGGGDLAGGAGRAARRYAETLGGLRI